jgi:hypothetical protein
LVCRYKPLCCSFPERLNMERLEGGAPVDMCPLGPASQPFFCVHQCPWMCSRFLCTICDIVASGHGESFFTYAGAIRYHSAHTARYWIYFAKRRGLVHGLGFPNHKAEPKPRESQMPGFFGPGFHGFAARGRALHITSCKGYNRIVF